MAVKHDIILPPPIVNDMTLREWLVGCVLQNNELISNVPPEKLGHTAVSIADDIVMALRAPAVPKNVDPPTEETLLKITDKIQRSKRITLPSIPNRRSNDQKHAIRPPKVDSSNEK